MAEATQEQEFTLTHSPTIGALALALASANKKFKAVKKDQVNPFFKSKYADLSAVIEATDAALCEEHLAIVQSPVTRGDKAGVITMLIHESGEWMRGELLLPVSKADAQGVGSAITYARRYSYQGFVNVAAETDDDANAASGKTAEAKAATMPKPPKPNGEDTFKVKFWRTAKGKGKSDEQIRNIIGFLGYEKTEEIPLDRQPEAMRLAAE